MAEKQSMADLIKSINKEFGGEILHQGKKSYNYRRIPFTSPRLNYVTFGGIPMGKLIEFYGDEHSGKTTTALDIVANYQKMEDAKGIVYADLENTLDEVWATKLGVDFDRDDIYLMNPTNQGAETIFQKLLDMISTDEIGLVVIDSIGVMVSNMALEKSIEDKTYGGIAMALTNFSKQAAALCNKHNCTLIGINQMRDNLASPYGGEITTGGKAWRHNCSTRLEFRHGKFFDEKYKPLSQRADGNIGNFVEVYMSKNKTCPPSRHNGFYTLKYETGIDYLYDLIEVCIENGCINQRGSYFDILDASTGEVITTLQGQSNLYSFLANEENKGLLDKLSDVVNQSIDGE